MQKQRRIFQLNFKAFAAVILLILAICLLFCACNKKTQKPLDNSPCYDMSITYDDGVLHVNQEILYTAPANLNEVVLNIYANAFDKENNAINILSAQINRKTIDFEIYGSDRTLLKLPYNLKNEHIYNITLEYTVNVPSSCTRLGITDSGITNLACFYPVLAHYDGSWREDEYCKIGDPFYHDISSFYVSLTVDENMTVATSGQIVETKLFDQNGKPKKSVEICAEYIRDFGMAVGKLKVLSESIGSGAHGVEIKYCYFDDDNAAQTMERIKQSVNVFSEAFGEYPYNSLTVAQSDLDGAGGMEYGTYVTVSKAKSQEEYFDVITHEIAHQWWYNLVGSDQINNAWLDEGLTEFCTYYFYYLIGDRTAYATAMANMSRSYSAFASHADLGFNGKMNRPLSSYLTEGEYSAVTYFKGALLFDCLRTLVGDNKFLSAMRRYLADNSYRIATQDDLIAAFKTQGYDISGIIKSWTEDLIKITM